MDFTSCTANGQAIGTYATSATEQLDMATKHGVTTATTSGLGGDGESFSVTWLNASARESTRTRARRRTIGSDQVAVASRP